MYRYLYHFARRLWPELERISEQRRLVGVGDVVFFVATLPLAVGGLVWLWLSTDLSLIQRQWLAFLFFQGIIFLFNRVNFFFIVEIRVDRYGSADGSLGSMLQWSAALLFGPSALWFSIIDSWINQIRNWPRALSTAARWSQARSFAIDLASNTLAYLLALKFYTWAGGEFPPADLSLRSVMLAGSAMLVHFLTVALIWSGYILYAMWIQRQITHSASVAPIVRFFFSALGLPFLAHPFAILIAGLYIQNGPGIAMFLVTGLLLVAYLARQLSWAAENSRQRMRQLEKLEHLSRDIIKAPPDGSKLSDLLAEHVPMMFPSGRTAIWLLPDQFYMKNPPDWEPPIETIWGWVRNQQSAQAFLAGEKLPWIPDLRKHDPLTVTPILDVIDQQPIGCIYMELRSLVQPWDKPMLNGLYPALHSLAAQVASALQQIKTYRDSLDYQATLQELEFAGKIQASFLPSELPGLTGWELAVTLLPARETSGDYFDIIPFSDGRVGFLIADVTDKGLGAALYMALSRTLFRTFAMEYEASPEIVFFSVNERILQDARANLFVTAFYGILDLHTGQLNYANAGHNPPMLISPNNGGAIQALTPTGMPIGIDNDEVWSQATAYISPGDTLVLYTDGIPDAQDNEDNPFRERRLIEVVQANSTVSAQEMQVAILENVQAYVGNAPQFDDITLLVIQRNSDQTASESAQEPAQELDQTA